MQHAAESEAPFDVNEITGIVTKGGETIEFDKRGWLERPAIPRAAGIETRNDTLYAQVDQLPYSIALDDIAGVRVVEPDTGNTAAAAVGITLILLGGLFALAYATADPL